MLFYETLSVAICAWVFTSILTAPGMIFEWWYMWLEKTNTKAPWLAKPLGYCGVCFSGQLGFWWYLLVYVRSYWGVQYHIIYTCQVIFFYLVLNTIDKKWNLSGLH